MIYMSMFWIVARRKSRSSLKEHMITLAREDLSREQMSCLLLSYLLDECYDGKVQHSIDISRGTMWRSGYII